MKAQKTVCIALKVLGCAHCEVIVDHCDICWVEFEKGDGMYCYRARRQHYCKDCYERLKSDGVIE